MGENKDDLEFPFKFEPFTDEQRERRAKVFGEKSVEYSLKKAVPG